MQRQVLIEAGSARAPAGDGAHPAQSEPSAKRSNCFSVFGLTEERRPGALDYRNIPSLMGGVRVPYRTSFQATGQSGGGDGND